MSQPRKIYNVHSNPYIPILYTHSYNDPLLIRKDSYTFLRIGNTGSHTHTQKKCDLLVNHCDASGKLRYLIYPQQHILLFQEESNKIQHMSYTICSREILRSHMHLHPRVA